MPDFLLSNILNILNTIWIAFNVDLIEAKPINFNEIANI